MLSRPIEWFGLICLIFLNSCWLQGDEADLFNRFENRANEEVVSREKELQAFKPEFRQQNENEGVGIIPAKATSVRKDVVVQFQRIQIVGSYLLPERTKAKLVKPYLNQSITLQQLDELIVKISQWYFELGFNTTLAGFSEESFSEKGVLKI